MYEAESSLATARIEMLPSGFFLPAIPVIFDDPSSIATIKSFAIRFFILLSVNYLLLLDFEFYALPAFDFFAFSGFSVFFSVFFTDLSDFFSGFFSVFSNFFSDFVSDFFSVRSVFEALSVFFSVSAVGVVVVSFCGCVVSAAGCAGATGYTGAAARCFADFFRQMIWLSNSMSMYEYLFQPTSESPYL